MFKSTLKKARGIPMPTLANMTLQFGTDVSSLLNIVWLLSFFVFIVYGQTDPDLHRCKRHFQGAQPPEAHEGQVEEGGGRLLRGHRQDDRRPGAEDRRVPRVRHDNAGRPRPAGDRRQDRAHHRDKGREGQVRGEEDPPKRRARSRSPWPRTSWRSPAPST